MRTRFRPGGATRAAALAAAALLLLPACATQAGRGTDVVESGGGATGLRVSDLVGTWQPTGSAVGPWSAVRFTEEHEVEIATAAAG